MVVLICGHMGAVPGMLDPFGWGRDYVQREAVCLSLDSLQVLSPL
jgi:hypothetical protein